MQGSAKNDFTLYKLKLEVAGMKKKLLSLVLTAALAVTGVVSSVGTVDKVQAESKEYMKKLDLKWDLKKNKNLTFTQNFGKGINKKYSLKMTGFKVTNASKEGYKKLTVSFTITRKWNPTKNDIQKIINRCNKAGADYLPNGFYYTVADYDTGVSLEGKNSYHVKVKSLKNKQHGVKKYYGTQKSNWVKLEKSCDVKFEVTYPEDYKGLCIGIGGSNGYSKVVRSNNTIGKLDELYFEGNKSYPFGKTSFYKQGKKNSHWLRVE